MRRSITKVWSMPSDGIMPALAVTSAFFFLGGVLGCILAARVGGGGSDSLAIYLKQFVTAAGGQTISQPPLLPLIWETLRWPLLIFLLGFTTLGLLGIPIVLLIRGFLLAFSIASFVRMFGSSGGLLAFLIFGVSGCVALPVLFVLAVQGILASRYLATRFLGEGRRNSPYGKRYFLRCGICAGALCVCVFLEFVVVPALVAGGTNLLQL